MKVNKHQKGEQWWERHQRETKNNQKGNKYQKERPKSFEGVDKIIKVKQNE